MPETGLFRIRIKLFKPVGKEVSLKDKSAVGIRNRDGIGHFAGSVFELNGFSFGKLENGFAGESEILRQFRRTIDPENARKIMLYLDENGDLCGIGYCYSLAGADKYLHTVNLTHHEIPDLYLKYLNK